jgi:thymidylate kinase
MPPVGMETGCKRANLVGTDILQQSADREAYPVGTIPALAALLDDFAAQRLRYCLWKSNLRLPQALNGTTDLDLLIDPQQAGLFRAIIGRHPVKTIVPPPGAAYPGMEHFLGFDRPSGRLFHLHVHYQMVLGERYVKNHRVPMEREFLDSVRTLGGVPVPSASLELSILSMRALLKYRGRDVIKDILGIRSPGIAEDIHAEIEWLLDQTSVDEVRAALKGRGLIPADLVCKFLETMIQAPRSGSTLFRLRERLRREVGGLRRHGGLKARVQYLGSAWRQRRRFRRTPRRDPRMTPAGGGSAVALVGADGSGKSTISQALADWLGWKLEARVYYMGSKQPSRTSSWLYLAFRAQRRTHRALDRNLGGNRWITRIVGASRDVTLALHHLSIGRDRARRYRDALRDFRTGAVVIFDRFPFEHISNEPGARLLDGPQITASVGGGRLVGVLAGVEERMYRRFRLPDHLFVLQAKPEVSAERKPDHALDVIVAKSRAVLELGTLAAACGAAVARIDADRPLDEVMLDTRSRLWDVL